MAKCKVIGIVIEVFERYIHPDNPDFSHCEFVIKTTDDHSTCWYFRGYGDASNFASRLIEGDEVEVDFTSRDKKGQTGRWYSNKVAINIKILSSAPPIGDDGNWNK